MKRNCAYHSNDNTFHGAYVVHVLNVLIHICIYLFITDHVWIQAFRMYVVGGEAQLRFNKVTYPLNPQINLS